MLMTTVYEVRNVPGKKRLPRWQRTLLETETGELYAPGALLGGEMNALLCAGFDGIATVEHRGHLYFPLEWMAREDPKLRPTLTNIRERLAEARRALDDDK